MSFLWKYSSLATSLLFCLLAVNVFENFAYFRHVHDTKSEEAFAGKENSCLSKDILKEERMLYIVCGSEDLTK